MIELQESTPDRVRRARYFFIDSSMVYEENYFDAHIYPEFSETIYKKDSILYEYSSKPSYNADISQLTSTSYEVKKTEKKTNLTTIPESWLSTGSDFNFDLCGR